MKQYKHIPTGKTATECSAGYNFSNTIGLLPKEIVESGKDWAEIKPEYTILSFMQRSGITDLWTMFPNGWCRTINGKDVTAPFKDVESILITDHYYIFSVRRESDGEVFTVGDHYNLGIIKLIKFKNNAVRFYNGDGSSSGLKVTVKSKLKEWEITAIRNKGEENQNEWYKTPEGLWTVDESEAVSWETIPNFCEIYSVKRLSDNIEFAIGDNFTDKCENNLIKKCICKIKSIEFIKSDNTIQLSVDDEYACDLLDAVKVEKLFTTEDGVDIYDGGIYWINDGYYKSISRIATKIGPKLTLADKAHSTKEAAEEYILMNKPCLSYKEVENIFETNNESYWEQRRKLRELVKNKIK